MSKLNKSSQVKKAARVVPGVFLAGGGGAPAAKQENVQLLRRAVMTSLLWENLAYESGDANANNIATLVAHTNPRAVADIAIEARRDQKLRHVPLYLAVQMAKHPTHRHLVEEVLENVITRADQITDFLALYWEKGKCPLAAGVKRGLAKAFNRFGPYALAKYNRDAPIKLRDAMFMVHPTPKDDAQAAVFKKLADNTLEAPETWEVMLSIGQDKKATFTKLIEEEKLGSLAFLRNLRNMKEAGVQYNTLKKGFDGLARQALLPLNFYGAYVNNPEFGREIEDAMFKTYANVAKLPGHTVYIVDVSGSMDAPVSAKSKYRRREVAAALASFAAETSERITVYATGTTHKRIDPVRGFGLAKAIEDAQYYCGGGGIYTKRVLEFVKADLKGEVPDRIIVFSDSQDCETGGGKPQPFGKNNYIVDISSHKHGINYKGIWTAEISGWSENLLTYIRALEGFENNFEDSVEN